MKAVIYSKDNCVYCERAIMLLNGVHADLTILKSGVDFTNKELKKMLPQAKTFPQVFIDDEHIGGYEDLVRFFK